LAFSKLIAAAPLQLLLCPARIEKYIIRRIAWRGKIKRKKAGQDDPPHKFMFANRITPLA